MFYAIRVHPWLGLQKGMCYENKIAKDNFELSYCLVYYNYGIFLCSYNYNIEITTKSKYIK
jgi:hypothetical protein